MKFKLVVLFLMLTSNILFAQASGTAATDYVCLVRLTSLDKTIAELEKANLFKIAAKRKVENDENNKQLIKSYKENFDFCPIYFFYDKDTKAVLRGQYDGIILNEELQARTFSPSPTTALLVSDYGIANPKGETYRYNNQGVKISFIEGGEIKEFRTDASYASFSGLGFFKSKYRKISISIQKMNERLKRKGTINLSDTGNW